MTHQEFKLVKEAGLNKLFVRGNDCEMKAERVQIRYISNHCMGIFLGCIPLLGSFLCKNEIWSQMYI